MKPLTPRRERFVQEYLIDLDAPAAAARAGYKTDVQRRYADWLARQPEVAAAIHEAQLERGRRCGIDAERVVRELFAIAFSDIRNLVSWRALKPPKGDGADVTYEVRFKDSSELDDSSAAAIQKVRRTNLGGLQIRLHDKLAALALLARHLGMFTPKPGPRPQEPIAQMRELVDGLAGLTPEVRAALREVIKAGIEGRPLPRC